MNELKCPHCGKTFAVDESGYAELTRQVRDHEFDKQLRQAIEVTELRLKSEQEKLNSKLEQEIQTLKSQAEKADLAQQLAIQTALRDVSKERDDLKSELDRAGLEKELLEKSLVERYESQLKDREGIIERLQDFRAQSSTKMVGEVLEQHCSNQFDMVRAAAFPRATFGKDNTVADGSKGDFIFREVSEGEVEIISIMFEMKNESDTTKSKKKNQDFLEELDKDRRLKNCEYAVLVSLLEADNELYNAGIVDMSHLYPKMYVVRPQFFIPIISLLRNAALGTVAAKAELEIARRQHVDVEAFSKNLETFKAGFERNYRLASDNMADAVSEIEKSIKALEKTRDALLKSANNLRLANDKAQDVTIKRLTKGNPTMTQRFAEIAKKSETLTDVQEEGAD
ncbi:MAG: DUF2130 domain-containing protein [Micrococcales bacterium]|nr:DUF2130 domain-containing protein [Micrococcales bacterium]